MNKKTESPKIDPKEPRLTAAQAAPLLKLCPRIVQQKCSAGTIRAIKPGKVWEIPESAISEYLGRGLKALAR